MKSELEKAMFIGLYLSKFDKEALFTLGFKTFSESYNVLGLAIGVKPLSIRGYRDEFDPVFPNKRQGWHRRAMHQSRLDMLEKYQNLDFKSFTKQVKNLIYNDSEIDILIDELENCDSKFSKRLMTGLSAEEYFRQNFHTIPDFEGCEIEDTTKMGCGFDFRLYNKNEFYAVEVKGLSEIGGNILLTPKEYKVANYLQDRYSLFVVQNFIKKPFHSLFFNPLNHENLSFSQQEQIIRQVNWMAKV